LIRLKLPIPPSVNHIYRRGRNGQVYKSASAREFQDAVTLAVYELWEREEIRVVQIPLRLQVRWVLTSRRRWDIDNGCKLLLDSLAACFHFDDNDVVDLRLTKVYEKGGVPRCEVALSNMKEKLAEMAKGEQD